MIHVETPSAVTPDTRGVGPIPSPTRRMHVLVVDDDRASRDFMDMVLRNAGYITARAVDGAEALEMAAQFGPFDLLVTDEMMPRMEGHVLAQRMREREPWLKVLYLTGFGDYLLKAKGALWEDEMLLDKPATVAGFLEAVSHLLKGRTPTASS